VDQSHNILTLDTGILLLNATTNGLTHHYIVTSTRARRVGNTLMMHPMLMLLVELMWKVVVGGDEEVGYIM
jgi:hypothetical protein